MQLYDLIRVAAKESHYPTQGFSDEYLENLVYQYKTGDLTFLYYTEDGFIAGCLSEHFLLPGKVVALEMGFFILPEERGRGKARPFIKAFDTWAKEQRADYIFQGYPSKDSTELYTIYSRKF